MFEKTFETICIIGEGAFGKVYKVRHKHDNQLYALKECKLNGKLG